MTHSAFLSASLQVHYRDRVYLIEDIILKLIEYGELNQTALVAFCGLNLTKHRPILEELESKDLIKREMTTIGKRSISVFRATQLGIEFCNSILAPYEKMFPRRDTKKE